MVYSIGLYASLIIFGIGLLYRISSWFRRDIGIYAREKGSFARVGAAFQGILGTLFSEKIVILLKVFFLDVLFQRRVLKEDVLRWVMHMLIYWGFMLLLLMHALDGLITQRLFSDYASTLNPFMFLRDLFGFMVIVGIAIALVRRFILKVPRLRTDAMDYYAIVILAVIMLSGIFLEGTKITSHTRYQEMVEEYSDADDEEEARALESYWVKRFQVVSPTVKGPFDEEVLEKGAELHELSCEACHSVPAWAFTGYAAALAEKPFALALDRARMTTVLWTIHFLACFIGLAYLPFSKMMHIIASPISLLANAVMEKETADPANMATKQVMELDACTHCGTCSLRCSVAAAFDTLGNRNILPSEKMVALKRYAANRARNGAGLRDLQEGVYLCTNCDRCTVVCPVGIRLKDLWLSVREELVQKGEWVPLVLTPFSFYRGLNQGALDPANYPAPLEGARASVAAGCGLMHAPEEVIPLNATDKGIKDQADRSPQASTYAYCFACENCTTVCPVVENYENPQETLGLLPHQIMRSLGLGVKDLALGSRMLWDCVTCYQCQEHCPQGVKVTDVLYELKNMAIRSAAAGPGADPLRGRTDRKEPAEQ